MSTHLTPGAVALLTIPRYRGHVAIVSCRRISRGRNAGKTKFVLASLEPKGFGKNTYCMNLSNADYLSAPTKKFTAATVTAAISKVHGTRNDIEDRKEVRAAKGRDAQGNPDWDKNLRSGLQATDKMAVGDTVVIKYRGGSRRNERLVGINVRTGKIAIDSPRNKSGKRWLPTTMVVEVIKAGGQAAPAPTAPAPTTPDLNPAQADLNNNWGK